MSIKNPGAESMLLITQNNSETGRNGFKLSQKNRVCQINIHQIFRPKFNRQTYSGFGDTETLKFGPVISYAMVR